MEKQMSVDIDEGLHDRLKKYTHKNGMILKFVVAQAVESYLDNNGD